jgi:uncharacterized Zn finger protein (UPF0148 family)
MKNCPQCNHPMEKLERHPGFIGCPECGWQEEEKSEASTKLDARIIAYEFLTAILRDVLAERQVSIKDVAGETTLYQVVSNANPDGKDFVAFKDALRYALEQWSVNRIQNITITSTFNALDEQVQDLFRKMVEESFR